MERGLKVPLSPNEEITLRRVAYGIAHRETLRPADILRLEILGLVADGKGILSLTPIGQQRLARLPTGAPAAGSLAGDPYVEALAKALGVDKP
jgi:hypothetical protein